jgi:Pup amidohydrolase
MGVETEYAIRCKQNATTSGAVLDFDRLMTSLGYEIPIAPSFRNPYRLFLANGGCVSLETGASPSLKNAMLESATPECYSPHELLCYQVAMEKLLSEVVSSTFVEQDAHLLKGSADAHGHTYGQHESYEVQIAKGSNLIGWRIGLLLMLPALIGYRILASIWFLMLGTAGFAVVAMQRLSCSFRKPSPNRRFPKGNGRTWKGMGLRALSPKWVSLCAFGLRLFHAPIAWMLWVNIYFFALRPHRRNLSAFLASRCIVDGAGYLDKENRFWVSARASTINSGFGFGSYGKSCPLLRCDSWLRGLCIGPLWTLGNFVQLFGARQRIEIAIGDSGMCEQSQYVRLGSTALVLDLIEKSNPKIPRLKNPIEAIGRFARDWMLLSSVPDITGRQWNAIDIQHAYAASVRQMLQSKSNVPIEAWKILDQWQTTLNQLHPTDDEANLPRAMLGRIDWLSKLWLLHQANKDATWQARKKIDLRYHELSSGGYHRRLSETLELAPILDPLDISRSRRTPPSNSPATQRGYLIREFSSPECKLHVDWTHAQFVFEGKKKSVRF